MIVKHIEYKIILNKQIFNRKILLKSKHSSDRLLCTTISICTTTTIVDFMCMQYCLHLCLQFAFILWPTICCGWFTLTDNNRIYKSNISVCVNKLQDVHSPLPIINQPIHELQENRRQSSGLWLLFVL